MFRCERGVDPLAFRDHCSVIQLVNAAATAVTGKLFHPLKLEILATKSGGRSPGAAQPRHAV